MSLQQQKKSKATCKTLGMWRPPGGEGVKGKAPSPHAAIWMHILRSQGKPLNIITV